MRAQLRYDGRRVCVRSRPGRDCTAEFPELAAIAEALAGRRVLLDGELVCLDADGRPNFAALRSRLGQHPGRGARLASATLMIFDALHLDGRATRHLPYAARRELLASLKLEGPAWRTPRHFVGQAEHLLAATAEQDLEGVVAKRIDAAYREGRSRAWIKLKNWRRERLAVTGWRECDGALPEFLLARVGADGRLRPAGRASLGLDAGQRAELLEALATRERARPAEVSRHNCSCKSRPAGLINSWRIACCQAGATSSSSTHSSQATRPRLAPPESSNSSTASSTCCSETGLSIGNQREAALRRSWSCGEHRPCSQPMLPHDVRPEA